MAVSLFWAIARLLTPTGQKTTSPIGEPAASSSICMMKQTPASMFRVVLLAALLAPLAPCGEPAQWFPAILPDGAAASSLTIALPCDTWVALPDITREHMTILAKNSDRPLFDCQPLERHPRQTWPADARIDLGRLSIDQVSETYATLGSSPYWCWGYEEGVNEFGVAIGNEGVRTRPLVAALAACARGETPTYGPTGMDLVRLGLERARTAREALDIVTDLLEEHGQFGSGLPTFPDATGAYDNTFLIADPTEAWVLETAGRLWAARRFAKGSTSISNLLTLTTSFDLASDDLVARVVELGWWPAGQGKQFHFAEALTDPTPAGVEQLARSRIRAECSRALLLERHGAIDQAWMMRIARDRSSTPSLDLDQTASSCVVSLPHTADRLPIFWWCAGTPSNGCYVPFFVHGSALPAALGTAGTQGRRIVPPGQATADRFAEASYWWLGRDLCDQIRLDHAKRNPLARAAFDPLEAEFAVALKDTEKRAVDLRAAGRAREAALVLDQFSAECVARVVERMNEVRRQMASLVVDAPAEFQRLVGEYVATINGNRTRILVQNGQLAIELPGRGVFELKPPDAKRHWCFALASQVSVSFERDAEGVVLAMMLHQPGTPDLELVRDGVVIPPEIPIEELQRYVGHYRSPTSNLAFDVLVQNNRLAVNWPQRAIFELRPPGEDGRWPARMGSVFAVRFHATPEGRVEALTHFADGKEGERLERDDRP